MIAPNMKHISGFAWSVTAASLAATGGYVALAVCLPAGETRIALIDIYLCIVPLFVNGALLLNAITPDWRTNTFWMLLASGCSLWLAGQAFLTYEELYHPGNIGGPYRIVFFLHVVPMIAALTMQPHKRPDQRKILYGYVDFSLMVCWWMYLYVFIVLPWQFVIVDNARYNQSYHVVAALENLVFAGGAAVLFMNAKGRWLQIYGHLTGAGATYAFGRIFIEAFTDRRTVSRTGLYDLPLVISLVWLGIVGIVAYRTRGEEDTSDEQSAVETSTIKGSAEQAVWAARGARAALLSLPVI
jgi:hypothetical protein